jgi:Homeodomain-like domain
MHIVLLASDGLSPTQIARVLFCSRTTVYAQSRPASSGRSEPPFSTAEGEARNPRSESRPTSASSVWWKRGRPLLMVGRAPAGAANSSPWSCLRSEPSW